MNLFARVGAAIDALWSALDPDEPVLCGCRDAFTCPDCSLAAPLDVSDWPAPAVAGAPTAAA